MARGTTSVVKPPIKWVGGKTQILDQVLEQFPRTINNYYEPFIGGGSVLLALLSQSSITVTGSITAGDTNIKLISMYKNIQSRPEELIREMQKLVDEHNRATGDQVNRKATTLQEALTSKESHYYFIRKNYNDMTAQEQCTPKGSAHLIFLNKTGFRGLYREGPNGFNVPYGSYRNPSVYDKDHIMSISRLIQPVTFKHCDFTECLATAQPGDFVYMDPPYAPETTTSFVGYTSDGFNEEKHKQLFDLCQNLVNNGVQILMSNADVKLVRDKFNGAGYHTSVISCKRAINSKKPNATTNEVLIKSLSMH